MSVSPVSPFKSFWMAGYECADHLNKYGDRVDLLQTTGHLQNFESDYDLLQEFNISTVREGIRWSVVEYAPYQYDWSAVSFMIDKGRDKGIQQLWDICHFGFPDDLTPLHPKFAHRFESLCRAFVLFYRSRQPHGPLMVTPINEVSFLSWLGGDACGTAPFCVRQGWEVKYHLMKAYIKGVEAMREVDPSVLIIPTEPLVHIVAPADATDLQRSMAATMREEQFQAIDMLLGRICPELGGSPEYADILGFNFYYSNQWMLHAPGSLPWATHDRHPEWLPLYTLLQQVFDRYELPMAITETSHPGEDRPIWLQHVADECAVAIEQGVPLWGICLYPIIDRPDWDEHGNWHRSGLWDECEQPGEAPMRILHTPYAEALLCAQKRIAAAIAADQLAVL